MVNYQDPTPVPDAIAPTSGNVNQIAEDIANWLRTKQKGKDVRESMARSIELFSTIYQLNLANVSGMKSQFEQAISGATQDSEVKAARASTAMAKTFDTIGLRFENAEQMLQAMQLVINSGVIKPSGDQTLDGVLNLTKYPTYNNGRTFMPAEDTGWLQSGVTFGDNVTSVVKFSYRIITIGSFRKIIFGGDLKVSQNFLTSNWGSSGRRLFTLPSGLKWADLGDARRIYCGSGGNVQPQFCLRAMDSSLYFDDYFTGTQASNFNNGAEPIFTGEFSLNDLEE
ncbi:hypothetical protein KBX49_09120 [Liquorilactobacillus satsumensis]|uniref:hypothetical protein n=1 Tax=Liquorilactobacillus satsumensis TaxID=259059 RepID=UPI0021C3057F|nr:hypothetical protein [Liquorilactobacillus satsumensis]MCP9357367.1 hypothetical protein [Liquorilactobacillus satsumensis]MCP9372073.1 hypothetical protein [Liquorilactobacillus satsumensis]